MPVEAVDISEAALAVAAKNIATHSPVGSVTLLHGNALEPLAACPDLVVANLPYLSDRRMETLGTDVGHEPVLALHGGPDGLDCYRLLLAQAHERSWRFSAIFEIDPEQADLMRGELERAVPGAAINFVPDLAGFTRIVEVRLCRRKSNVPQPNC